MFGKGKSREQRLAEKARQKAGPVPGNPLAARKAQLRLAIATRGAELVEALRSHGWTDVTCTTAGAVFVMSGTDPQGQRHAGSGPNGRALIADLVAQGGTTQEPGEDSQTIEAAAGEKIIIVAGKTYAVSADDALRITAAFMQVLNRNDTSVTLESGEILPVTAATIDEISNQLAGA